MTSEPKIIKIESTGQIYINQTLRDFIEKVNKSATDEIKENDNLYFFKNVEFRRDKLSIAAKSYNRVIKLSKANAIIINTTAFALPDFSQGLYEGKVFNAFDPDKVDDIIYNIGTRGQDFITLMLQYLELFKLTNKPRVVDEVNLNTYVNNGLILDEDSYEEFKILMGQNEDLVISSINSLDFEKNIEFLSALIYFQTGSFGEVHWRIWKNLNDSLKTYLFTKYNSKQNISLPLINKMREKPNLDKMVCSLINEGLAQVLNGRNDFNEFIEIKGVEFIWKE